MDTPKEPPPQYSELGRDNAGFSNVQQTPPNNYAAPPQYGFVQQPYGMAYSPQMQNSTSLSVVTQQPVIQQPPVPVPDTLPLAICATICCFWLGIVAISRTMESKHHLMRNDHDAAMTAAMSARRFSGLAIGMGVVITVAVVITVVVRIQLMTDCYYNDYPC